MEYKVNNNVSIVFLGNSQVQLGIDDKIVENSVNLSYKSEPFFFTFYKLKGLLKENPSIKKVCLGFGYSSLSSYNDDFVSKQYSERYFFILPISEKFKLIKYNLKRLPIYCKGLFEKGIDNILEKDNRYTFLGYFENDFGKTKAVKNSMEKRYLYHFYSHNKVYNFSENNFIYLNKIIDMCKKNRLDLVILKMPIHNYYKDGIPKNYIEKYNQIVVKNRLHVIDFEDLIFTDDCFLKDGDHLAPKGTVKLSSYLNEKFKSKNKN